MRRHSRLRSRGQVRVVHSAVVICNVTLASTVFNEAYGIINGSAAQLATLASATRLRSPGALSGRPRSSLSRAPTDPDMRSSRIRLFESSHGFACVL